MIIATRDLQIIDRGQTKKVTIEIYLPLYNGIDWTCRYQIGWPGETRDSFGAGFDAVQALHSTLQKIGIDIYMSRYHDSGTLIWTEPGDGYGFPIPKNGRDMLIGADKIFEG